MPDLPLDAEAQARKLVELERKSAYFEKQVEQMAGRLVRADAANSRLRHEIEQRRRGFALLSSLTLALDQSSELDDVFAATCKNVNATLNMEQALLLLPDAESGLFRPAVWHGFPAEQAAGLPDLRIDLPWSILHQHAPLLVNGATELNSADQRLRDTLGLRFFIAVPVLVHGEVVATLLTGRTREQKPFLPRLDHGDLEIVQSIGAFLGSVISRARLVEMQTANDRLRVEHDRLELARQHAEAMVKARTEFIATVSHEVRTPLNGVLGMARLLTDTKLDTEQQELARTILSSGESLLTILNDLLDLSKLEAGKLELERIEFDLVEQIEDCAALMSARAGEKKVAVASNVAGGLPRRCLGDPHRLRQILLNLLGNAVKFTTAGAVTVTADLLGQSDDSVRLRISVRDTGLGISAEALGNLFQRYAQADAQTARQFGGTGLGLSICKQLVELMDGRIGADSVLGAGSVFWFEIKLGCGAPTPRPVAAGQDRLLMLVEPVQPVRDLIQRRCREWGWSIEAIADPATATQRLQEGAAIGHSYAVLILSHRLGAVDLQAIRQAQPGAATLMLAPIGAPRIVDDGGVARLAEPFRESDLAQALDWLVADPARRGPLLAGSASSPAASQQSQALRPLSILLAEDNPVNRKVAMGMLGKQGHKVTAVEDGAKAVAALRETAYELVLMDRHMPEMDGIEATKAIRALDGEAGRVPIIALTAAATQQEAQEFLDAGMDAFVSKPINPQQLFSMMAKVMAGSYSSE